MTPADATTEDRHGRILAELAGLSLELARDLQARATAAESGEEAARLASAFHQVSRGLRQTLALELKVIRFRGELAREAQAAEAAEVRRRVAVRDAAVEARRWEVASQVRPLIWTEREDELSDAKRAEAERLDLDFDGWLQEAQRRPDFLEVDVDDLIIEACEVLGFDTALLYEPVDPDSATGEVQVASADSS
jgi:hypothetical protein